MYISSSIQTTVTMWQVDILRVKEPGCFLSRRWPGVMLRLTDYANEWCGGIAVDEWCPLPLDNGHSRWWPTRRDRKFEMSKRRMNDSRTVTSWRQSRRSAIRKRIRNREPTRRRTNPLPAVRGRVDRRAAPQNSTVWGQKDDSRQSTDE
jgi:hypothetical protein